MVQYCIVPQCKNCATTPGISFHKLPEKEELKRAWIMKIQRDESCSEISSSMRICSAHFMPENYREVLSGRKFLKPDAIPSVFFFTSSRRGLCALRKIACKDPNEEMPRKTCSSFLEPRNQRYGSFTCEEQVCLPQSEEALGPGINIKMELDIPTVKSEPMDGIDAQPPTTEGFEFVSVEGIKQERIDDPCEADQLVPNPLLGSGEDDLVPINDGKSYPCLACGVTHANIADWQEHRIWCRSVREAIQHDHVYASLVPLKRWERFQKTDFRKPFPKPDGSLGKQYRCVHCRKLFCSQHKLTVHMKLYVGGMKFECGRCKARFGLYLPLTEHTDLGGCVPPGPSASDGQTWPKMFPCDICGRRFCNEFSLKGHRWKVHLNSVAFPCCMCDKEFPKESQLNSHHKNVHLKKIEFPCKLCNKVFHKESRLNSHLKNVHLGKIEFPCKLCDSVFYRMQSLNVHLGSVHPDKKLYPCNVCDEMFHILCELKRHKRNVHTNKLFGGK